MFKVGYLTPRETEIWNLRKKIDNQSRIGQVLGISRQAVYNSLANIEEKLERTFNEILDANNLVARNMDLVDGVMVAYSPAYKLPVVVSLSNTNGLKVWYLYEGNCRGCDLERSCRSMLRGEAKERGVLLKNGDRRLEPTRLALKVFSKYLTEGEIVG
jgi:hypothetical protein